MTILGVAVPSLVSKMFQCSQFGDALLNEHSVLGGYGCPKELHDDQLPNEVLVVATLDVDSRSCCFLSTVGERDELGRFRA